MLGRNSRRAVDLGAAEEGVMMVEWTRCSGGRWISPDGTGEVEASQRDRPGGDLRPGERSVPGDVSVADAPMRGPRERVGFGEIHCV